MSKINLRDIAELTPREQESFQRWASYHLRQYHPTPEQVQAKNEGEDNATNQQGQERC